MLGLDFPGYGGAESLQQISWDEWFRAFDENKLVLVYQEQTADGEHSKKARKARHDRLIGARIPLQPLRESLDPS